MLARVVFDVKDAAALGAALAGHPDLSRQDDGSYVWMEPASEVFGEGGHRSLGVVVPGDKRLVFEATSKPRAGRGRTMIEALAGSAVAYRATRYEDVSQALKRRPAAATREPGVPPEVEVEVVGRIDEPIPAPDAPRARPRR